MRRVGRHDGSILGCHPLGSTDLGARGVDLTVARAKQRENSENEEKHGTDQSRGGEW